MAFKPVDKRRAACQGKILVIQGTAAEYSRIIPLGIPDANINLPCVQGISYDVHQGIQDFSQSEGLGHNGGVFAETFCLAHLLLNKNPVKKSFGHHVNQQCDQHGHSSHNHDAERGQHWYIPADDAVQGLGHIVKGQGAYCHGNDVAVASGYQQGHAEHMPGIKRIEHHPCIQHP